MEPLKFFSVLSYKLKDSGRDAEIQFLLHVCNKRMVDEAASPSTPAEGSGTKSKQLCQSKRGHTQFR